MAAVAGTELVGRAPRGGTQGGSEVMVLPVDADIEEGDRVDKRLVALSQSNRVSGKNW